MTEIRIWNQKMPIEYLKENYRTPLPILAENKRKLKMNIDNTIKKNTKIRENRVFEFGDKNKKNINIKSNQSLEFNNTNNISNSQQFNNNEFGNEFTGEEYPSLDLVGANNENNINDNNNMTQNGMNNNGGNFNNQIGNDFVFVEKDFNFDK